MGSFILCYLSTVTKTLTFVPAVQHLQDTAKGKHGREGEGKAKPLYRLGFASLQGLGRRAGAGVMR